MVNRIIAMLGPATLAVLLAFGGEALAGSQISTQPNWGNPGGTQNTTQGGTQNTTQGGTQNTTQGGTQNSARGSSPFGFAVGDVHVSDGTNGAANGHPKHGAKHKKGHGAYETGTGN